MTPVKKREQLTRTLTADRVTKGAVRFTEAVDSYPMSIYLRKEQCADLGVAVQLGVAKIRVTIEGGK